MFSVYFFGSPVEWLIRVRLEANQMLLQTDNRGRAKRLFLALCGDSAQAKLNQSVSCKEALEVHCSSQQFLPLFSTSAYLSQ